MKVLQRIIFVLILVVCVMVISIVITQKSADFKTSSTIVKSAPDNLKTASKPRAVPIPNDNIVKETSSSDAVSANQKSTSVSPRKDTGKSDFPDKTAFIGDSITEGLSSYCLVDDEKVFASKGLTLIKAKDEIPQVTKINPERIFILFGANDLLYGMKSSEYTKSYKEFINLIKKSMPKTNIYVESILPVTEEVQNKKPLLANSRIDEFNSALIQMAKEEGVNYVNASGIFKNSKGCMDTKYSSDGIHLKFEAYKMWLNCLKNSTK